VLQQSLKKKLDKIENSCLSRQRHAITNRADNQITANQQKLINFSSNDYLNIATHPKVKRALAKGIEKFGLGSGSSALVSGYFSPHQALEERAADFLKRDRVILFNSGYHANLAVLTSLADRHTTVISDKLCHASLLDGITLSRAKHYRYRHNDIQHCEELLKKAGRNCLIVSESVFSMEGDINPTDRLARLANTHSATLIIDDAHGIGVLGNHGRGICEYYHLTQNDVPCLVSPLGKAFGSMGAFCSGSSTLIDGLMQFSNTYRYTTALPPAIALATIESINLIESESWRREQLFSLIDFFNEEAAYRSLNLISRDKTPIKSIMIGGNQDTMSLVMHLYQHGYYVSGIRPPTVPKGSSRIRISLNCEHKKQDILTILDLIAKYDKSQN
jgi:8-amino-7-oxononanoate synthase